MQAGLTRSPIRRRVLIVTPAPRHSLKGNRVTALRWAHLLRSLGHRVLIRERWSEEPCDVMIALHAKKSAESIRNFRANAPGSPLIVLLTGTDLYGDIESDPIARASIELATHLVVLQARGVSALPEHVRGRVKVIHQSATKPRRAVRLQEGRFIAAVLAHLRDIKDPLCAARAARRAPESSKLLVVHAGEALDPELLAEAVDEARSNPRYVWIGAKHRREALPLLAGSDVLVAPSLIEGGANVLSEAIACGVPIIASRIEGAIGILGEDHPGLFPAKDDASLAELLWRTESDRAFADLLKMRTAALSPLVDPALEREGLRALVEGSA
jgi:putative glycosyltransferase (TIGR04348 family)